MIGALSNRIVLAVIVALCLTAAVVWAAGGLSRSAAMTELRESASADLSLDMALLDSELQRHRATPVILATERPLTSWLERPTEAGRAEINARLETLAIQTGAAAIYVIDRRGVALAASNYRTPASFVGTNYAFRPYFREAMMAGRAEFYGQGTVSREPGLYISRRIDGPAGPLGVVVAKVPFDAVETAWRRQNGEVLVVDPAGVILLASRPERRFTTLSPLDEARRRSLAATRQFGSAPLDWSGMRIDGADHGLVGERPMLVSASAVGRTGWRLSVWTPTAPADAAASTGRWIAALSCVLAAFCLIWFWRGRRRARSRAQIETQTRQLLEQRVEERTRDLTTANDRLSLEVIERRDAERRLRRLQADLVQANRLAQLGQVMAGVAHEINQPVAAIRANADNALVLLDRRDEDQARSNLQRIQGLTDRIGGVVEGLRGLARKGQRGDAVAILGEAIEGALLLLASRDRGGDVEVHGPSGDIRVAADRVRLEQVLINLLQNAIEATGQSPRSRVALSVERAGDRVRIIVSDNGPGVSPEMRDTLFTPFATGKAEGLGLGLVISRDIVAGFGGSLSLEPPDGLGGARFVVTLKAAS